MKKINPSELKNIELNILLEFDKFCKENDLRYIIDYGTLLGAVRHKGFIPWDDDIDVTMPREDYEKLYKLIIERNNTINNHIKIGSARDGYKVYKAYFNAVDDRTITRSRDRRKKYRYPIWIDIFPADGYNNKSQTIYKECEQLRNKAYMCMRPYWIKYSKYAFYNLKNFKNRKILPEEYQNRADILAKSMNNTDILTNYMSPYGKKDILNLSYFNDYIMLEFEGMKFRAPREYDKRLRALYGDYMKLPPENQRKAHINNAYWIV